MPNALYPKWGWFVALGVFSLLLGIFACIDAINVSLASTVVFGLLLLIAGLFQVVHSFVVRGWSDIIFSALCGLLYIAGGLLLMAEPATGSILISLFIAICLIVGGITRLIIALRHSHRNAAWWVFTLGSVMSIFLGICVYATLPWSGLWLIGTIIGCELIFAGIGWTQFGILLRQTPNHNRP